MLKDFNALCCWGARRVCRVFFHVQSRHALHKNRIRGDLGPFCHWDDLEFTLCVFADDDDAGYGVIFICWRLIYWRVTSAGSGALLIDVRGFSPVYLTLLIVCQLIFYSSGENCDLTGLSLFAVSLCPRWFKSFTLFACFWSLFYWSLSVFSQEWCRLLSSRFWWISSLILLVRTCLDLKQFYGIWHWVSMLRHGRLLWQCDSNPANKSFPNILFWSWKSWALVRLLTPWFYFSFNNCRCSKKLILLWKETDVKADQHLL